MASITHKWKRFMMLSCNHGHLADESALKAVLDFKRKWKPDLTWHLGDNLDLAALRSGAKGTKDEAESLVDDFAAGIDFLKRLEPQKIFLGNHEARLIEKLDSPNAVVSYACGKAYGAIQDVAKSLKAEVVPYDIETGWRPVGDAVAGHGYMFNEMGIRDHAEAFGKCIIGHLHTVGQAVGRCLGAPTGYCVGALCDIPAMGYARRRRSTLRWSQGFAWGEYNEKECCVWLNERTRSGEWRSPLG